MASQLWMGPDGGAGVLGTEGRSISRPSWALDNAVWVVLDGNNVVRVITEAAWQALFASNMFVRETDPVLTSTQLADLVQRLSLTPVSYTHLRAHETVLDLVCRHLLEKKKKQL